MFCLPHSPAWNANSLDDTDHHLGHEDEEESHEVEGAVSPACRDGSVLEMMSFSRAAGTNVESCSGSSLKGLVDGPEPAHVGAGREEDEPQKGHAKVGRSATSTHPRQAPDQINSERCTVHCQHFRDGERMTKT